MARVLLVEDDLHVRPVFEELLIEAGHQVDTAESYREAAKLLSLNDYDLLLTDGQLPDGTGIMLADEVRAKGMAALIITGYPLGLLQRNKTVNLEDYTILRKPIAPSALLAAVSYEIGPRS